MNNAIGNYLPTPLLKVIGEYDAPIEHPRFRFFHPNEINNLLPKINQQEAKLQAHCQCSVM